MAEGAELMDGVEEQQTCIFKFKYHCDDAVPCSQNKGDARIKKIIELSEQYGDELHHQLHDGVSVFYHKNCVCRYVSPKNRHMSDTPRERKRLRKNDEPKFSFKDHCLYCANKCDVERSKKNPKQWKEAYICRTIHTKEGTPYRDYLLEVCACRKDNWGNEVQIRLEGALDLVAAEMRYHKQCLSQFMVPRKENPHSKKSKQPAFIKVCSAMEADPERIWNSIELFQLYKEHGGESYTKSSLPTKLSEHYGNLVTILRSQGYASLIAFRKTALSKLKLVKDQENIDDITLDIKRIAHKIREECKAIHVDTDQYLINIDIQKALLYTSPTMLAVLGEINKGFSRDLLPAVLIGNIVTGIVNNLTTPLQISLAVFLKKKSLLEEMYKYRVTATYDELLRFKKSVAVATHKDITKRGIDPESCAMVQIAADNFDAKLSTPNGKASTHALAITVMQPSTQESSIDDTIPRLSKEEVSRATILDSVPDTHIKFTTEKKPPMPSVPNPGLKDTFYVAQESSRQMLSNMTFAFFKNVSTEESCPEFNGYLTTYAREEGLNVKPKTKVVHLPLIDRPPSDPKTIATSLLIAKQISQSVNQEYVIYTVDQQLYKVALQVIWTNDVFSNVILRMGGMHLLMSYVGCIGILMEGSGLSEILGTVFGGVEHMLVGKKYPQNVRALRLLAKEILYPVITSSNPKNMDELQNILQTLSQMSRTSRMWVDCFLNPVFLICLYIAAERLSDWPLHLFCVQEMIPLFFAAGHYNYARYGLYYLRSMQAMPDEVLQQFMDGHHTMHHRDGLSNGIWSDMGIETTYMRYGHGNSGIIGNTLQPQTLKVWAHSHHACTSIVESLKVMGGNEDGPQMKHKEESNSRVKTDKKDRLELREKLTHVFDPLEPQSHPKGLINIYSGQVTENVSVNVDSAIEMGIAQAQAFESSWPCGFYDTIKKNIVSIGQAIKHTKVGTMTVTDPEVIYGRAMILRSKGEGISDEELLSNELTPCPSSIFEPSGSLRPSSAKSKLKSNLMVVEAMDVKDPDITFIDGCAFLWTIHWTLGERVQTFLDSVLEAVKNLLKKSDVCLVFDRYYEKSMKDSTRLSRREGVSRIYKLTTDSPLPPRKPVLTASENKVQLIELIVSYIVSNGSSLGLGSLIITGSAPIPVQLHNGVLINRYDMTTYHEEADINIIRQLIQCEPKDALILADDTDIFVLGMHFIHEGNIKSQVYMKSPKKQPNNVLIDLNGTAGKHVGIMNGLLASYALTGCDTVGKYQGIGKLTMLKVLRGGKHLLPKLGKLGEDIDEVVKEASKFIVTCYGQSASDTMNAARCTKYMKSLFLPCLAAILWELPLLSLTRMMMHYFSSF